MHTDESPVAPPGRTYEVEADQSLADAIVNAVADATGRRPVADAADARRDDEELLDPLYHTIDPDSLEALLSPDDARRDGDVEVSFSYCDCRVTVDSGGVVRVETREE